MRGWLLIPLAILLAACTEEPPADPLPLPDNLAALVGSWTGQEADGSTCRLYLSERQQRGGRLAVDQVCVGGLLMQVQAWELRGDSLLLHGPRPAMTLSAAGEGRFAGPGVVLSRRAE